GIETAVYGNRMGDVSHAIQAHIDKYNYGIVRELVGHGVGRDLHESPEVPNYGKKGRGTKLNDGLVIAIEPMVNMGTRKVVQESDGWTIRTSDRKPSAHYEHTVAVFKEGTEVLTTHKYIEENFKF
ncbi:MAG: M24 family metallopeptidase, partial [Bacteroidota bacterium]